MGIIGFGRIGQSTASYALGIGMKVLAADRFVQNVTISLNINDQNIDIDINTTSIEDVLKNADFISLHVPKQADGSAVISDKEIEDVIINLSVNNTHKTQQNISLLANESKTVELNFTSEKSEINNGLISVEDYPITYDNNLYFSFKTDEKINICQIYESENKNISKLELFA